MTGGSLVHGQVETLELHSLEELVSLLSSLPAHQAAAFGICGFPQAKVVTKSALSRARESLNLAIARDRDHFRWSDGPGVLFLDFDPDPAGLVLDPEQIVELLRKAA
jgi:hypothetical protein